jgi:FkbM family methyltransferase
MFRDAPLPNAIDGVWKTTVEGAEIALPIRPDRLWPDWDLARSIVGHDLDVKQLYLDLHRRDDVHTVFDVGANYGTQSLLWRAMGADVHAFEPNPVCQATLLELMALNGWPVSAYGVAIGDEKGGASLQFPEEQTWPGSLDQRAIDAVSEPGRVFERIAVDVITLDDFCAESGIRPHLVKLDTEGFELQSIRGARRLLETVKPIPVFESSYLEEREPLFGELAGQGYEIRHLTGDREAYTLREFVAASENNFCAGFRG